MLAWKVAPALATGNTVVLKPAETTSLTALLFAEVCQQAELPDGVVNIVTGDGSTGSAIVNHAGIHKIAFTGSTEVGKKIARAIAGTNKKATLELGGKARMSKIRVGDPLDKNTDLGAINSREQLNKINELSAAGDSEGAERWSPACNLSDKGFWFAPTIFTGVTQAHRIAREEIFGPVLSILTFRTPQEAIEKANNTPFGLSAGVWSEKGSRILWATQQLRAGVIWANTFNKFDPTSPFGGYKESGWGREGGKHGLASYLKEGK
jgi:aldehyde dehydrogenase (NAD+)